MSYVRLTRVDSSMLETLSMAGTALMGESPQQQEQPPNYIDGIFDEKYELKYLMGFVKTQQERRTRARTSKMAKEGSYILVDPVCF